MESVLHLDIRYNNADKNYGPMAYSQELAKEQCSLHQEIGTYLRIVEKTKEDIFRSIILKLRSIFCRFKEIGDSGHGILEYVYNSIIRDAEEVAEEGRVCNFYIIWGLHKAANASGLHSRPIAVVTDYVTGPAS
jgi:hypothetical protein